jgi:Tol biopolymer transport system component
MKAWFLAALLAAPVLAGCLGGPSERAQLEVSEAFDLRRLTTTPQARESQPAVSGDGRTVVYTAFTDAGSAVFALDIATGRSVRLSAAQPGWDHAPTVNHDGRVAAWVSVSDGDSDIWASLTDGTGLHAVTRNDARDVDPALSPDGTKVAYVSNRWGNPEVVVQGTDGSGERRLTSNLVAEFQPTFSRDGSRLAFIGYPAGSEVFVMGSDGGNLRRLTDNGVIDVYPDLDHTGGVVAYAAGLGGLREIYLQRVDGGVTRLTQNRFDEWTPRVTADGRQVLFRSEGARNATEHLIMAVQADGTGLVALAKGQDFGMDASGRVVVIVAQDDLWLLTRR